MNPEARRAAIRYWERLRIVYNLLLLPPAGGIYFLRTAVSDGVGDTRYLESHQVFLLFVLAWIGANICYSFVYALEFLFGSPAADSKWNGAGRVSVFIAGTAFAMLLAVFVARDIGGAAFSPTWISDNPKGLTRR